MDNSTNDVNILIDKDVLPEEVQDLRLFMDNFNPETLDKMSDGIVAQGYASARKSKSFTLQSVAKNMGISYKLFQYYLDKYPKFAIAVRTGLIDSVTLMKEHLTTTLYEVATGITLADNSKTVKTVYNSEGEIIGTEITTKDNCRQLAPNVTATLELLRKLDPEWQPKVNVDVQLEINKNIKVAQDITVAPDLKKLSPSALKELLLSARDMTPDAKMDKTENKEYPSAVKRGRPPKPKAEKLAEEKPKRKYVRKQPLKKAKEDLLEQKDKFYNRENTNG